MTNRRKARRFVIRLQGTSVRHTTRGVVKVQSRNLSGQGAYVVGPASFEAGDDIVLRFAWPSEKRLPTELEARGCVVRVDEILGEGHGLAIRFRDFPKLLFESGKKKGASEKCKTPGIFRPRQSDPRAFEYYSSLKKARAFLEENYCEPISLEKIARVAAMEKTYFSSFFKQKTGVNFSDWLRRYRVVKAIEMMQREDFSISDIAYEVGFGDLRTFERAFRRYTDMTPRNFRSVVAPR